MATLSSSSLLHEYMTQPPGYVTIVVATIIAIIIFIVTIITILKVITIIITAKIHIVSVTIIIHTSSPSLKSLPPPLSR